MSIVIKHLQRALDEFVQGFQFDFLVGANLAFQIICVGLTALFIVFCCIPVLHKRARSILRPWAVYHVENGLYWVALLQQYRKPLLTMIMEQSSQSVSVGFYGSSLPVLIWLGFPRLGSDLCLLMAITLYVGNAMKDLVSSPRPLGLRYGSVRLVHIATLSEETKKNAEEFGLPSSHAMNTLCFNFYACHYLHKYGYFPDGAAIFVYSMVTLWVLWIAVSRVYLGLHTPIDILAGAVAGLAVLTAFISVENLIQDFIHLPHSWFYAIMISLMLLRLHPTPASHTPSYEFTTSFVGVAFGVILAVSMKPEYFHHKEDISEIFSKGVHVALAKLCCGFTIVLVTKLVTRRVCSALLPIAYHWFPASIRQAWQPPVCAPPDPVTKLKKTIDGTQWADIDATVRFFSYASIGFAVCYIAPVAFEILDYV